jgi:serine phosphatase RsbU (regulator of sigma subunit)
MSQLSSAPPASAPVAAATDAATVDILLVDDQPANLLALQAVLAELGQNLVTARSGREALRYLLNRDLALILLDVQMPDMSGFETAALIRGRDRSRYTPIIFLTAHEQTDVQMFRGYSLGAVDYLVKPIVPEILRTKVSVFVEMFRKTQEVKRQAELLRELERQEHERQLAEAQERWEHQRLREEIRLARQIQQKLFPAPRLPMDGYDIGGASYPAEATGGDYFDYFPLPDDRLGIVIGDVSGHGFGPALLMAETRAYLRAFALARTDVGEILSLVNEALVRDNLEDRFATLMFARLGPAERSLVYVSAGHPPAYILNGSGEVRSVLKGTGLPLGIVPDCRYTAPPPVALQPGDIVFLLTDGIPEAHTPAGEPFGIDRALAVVRDNRERGARELVNLLYGAVREFCHNDFQLDDMTAIVIKVEGAP